MNQMVEAFIAKHGLIHENDEIIVAVSGGPDSMALLAYLQELQERRRILIRVAHVNHGLRGAESESEAAFVRSYCEKKSLAFYLHEPNVLERIQREQLSIQEAARASRYEWFSELMIKLRANKLAFAHHGDDQIETMLMRQIRGSLSGRKGIPIKRPFSNGMLIRPFLCLEKEELIHYCNLHKIPYKVDPSNDKDYYQRNRIRQQLLPFIKSENPKAHELFQWQSEVLTEEESFLEIEAENYVNKIILSKQKEEITISNSAFCQTPIALQRRVIHLILTYLVKTDRDSDIDRHHLDSLLMLIKKDHPSGSLYLPDKVAEKVYNKTVISTKQLFQRRASQIEPQQLVIPSVNSFPLGSLEVTDQITKKHAEKDQARLLVDLDKVCLPLHVRSRRKGDRIFLNAASGTKKLKDLFIDEKIPKRDRDLWPIIEDCHGTILWVPFMRHSNEVIVDKSSTNIGQLTYTIKN